MSGIKLLGTGRYLPERIVNNQDFSAFLDTSDEWIVSHTGIQHRRAASGEPNWFMGAEAAKQALQSAELRPEQVDMIIGTTVTPDFAFPSMACLVQGALGCVNAVCFDVAAACAGSTYAFDIAHQYLEGGKAKTILMVSSETLTQYTDYEDRASCILFGDGAGAVAFTASDGSYGSHLTSDGSGAGAIYARHARRDTPFSSREVAGHHADLFPVAKDNVTVMDGHEVFRFATRAMPEAIRKACEQAGVRPEELDLILPHQANIRIIKSAMRHLGIPMEKAYVNIQEYGNTSSASIIICLDECVRDGKLKPGDKICLVGFGAGLVCGAIVFDV